MDADIPDESRLRLKRFAIVIYGLLLLVTLVIALAGLILDDTRDLVLTVPIVVILLMTLFTDRHSVRVPPILIILMIATFFISAVGRLFPEETVIVYVVNFLVGVCFGLIGLILVYILLRSRPGTKDDSPLLVMLFVISVSLSMFVMLRLLQYYVAQVWDFVDDIPMSMLMEETLLVIVGSLAVCLLYRYNERHNLFRYTLGWFIEVNSDVLGLEDREREDILALIKGGESEHLEFKSTLRTNLQTGEVDKRMEKAVLKTIVAFLNSDGGNLLIGVSDDGSICGIDLDSFDSKDKLNLHLTNLISSQIGNGYLPYISFNMVDFDDKSVVRVRCEMCPTPVFLKDGKIEIFYVRSGPSSVELTGMNLINYVNNRQIGDIIRARKILKNAVKQFSDGENQKV